MPGLTSDIKQFYLKPLPGMNNKQEDMELSNHVELAQNCRFEPEPGAVSKRSPISYFNTSSTGSGAVQSLYRYYTSGGVKKWIKIWGTSAYVGDDSVGTWTAIRSSLSSAKKTTFVVYKDILIAGNGYDNLWCYDGSSDNLTWELGSCKAELGIAGAISRTTISYQVVPTVSGTDHVCAAVSNVIASAVSQKIELTNIPLGPAGTTARKIYRKSSETTGAYKLLTSIADNTTTTYTDNSNDASAGAAIGSTTDDMPLGNILKLHRERLFVSGDPTYPNKIYYSNPYLPHYIQQTTELDYMAIDENDGDEITGIPIQLGVMVCIKKNTIRPLHITSPVANQSPDTWYAEDPRSWNGSPAYNSVVQSPMGVIYLGWDHWYVYNGAISTPIIDEFDTNDILPAEYVNVVAHMDKGDLVWTYTDITSASQIKSRVMRYNFKRKALSQDVYIADSASVGIECFASRDGDDENGELFMGDAANGYVYKTENSDVFYSLLTKAECNDGTKTNIFVGGTEAAPYIEIGATASAVAIPVDICILWDRDDVEPEDGNGDSSGWTEITTLDDKYIKIDSGAVGATDTVGTTVDHATQISDDTTEIIFTNFRVFKKNSSTTEYQFPDGAIIMWDQSSNPTGFTSVTTSRYIKINSDLSDAQGTDYIWIDSTGSGVAEALDNYTEFRFIKKIGEADTWDGLSKYCYALYYAVLASASGWTNMSSTYDNYFLKTAEEGPTEVSGGDTETAVDLMWHPLTSHTYTGASNGANSIDGDSDTSFYNSYSVAGESVSGSLTATSQHTWDTARTITSVRYKLSAACAATSKGAGTNSNTTVKIEYTTDGTTWATFESLSNSASNSGGSSSSAASAYDATWTGSVASVKGIRAVATAGSNGAGGDASASGSVTINLIEAYCEPYAWATFNIARKELGKMKDYNNAIGTTYTAGTWTAPSAKINANTMKKVFWNETLTGSDNALIHTRTGATQVACEAASWSAALSNPNGSDIASTANIWLQYKIELTATDTTVSNPQVYFTNGYVLKYNYTQRVNDVDDSVEFRYKLGIKNFDSPTVDKIFKKIATRHDATEGSYLVKWETENSSGTFTVDLTALPKRWDSFFPSDAMGKEMLLEIYKNDNYDFIFKELQLLYGPEPILV